MNMKVQKYSTAELDWMEKHGTTMTDVCVVRQVDDLRPQFTRTELDVQLGNAHHRWDVFDRLLRLGMIEVHNDHQRSIIYRWGAPAHAVCLLFARQAADRHWVPLGTKLFGQNFYSRILGLYIDGKLTDVRVREMPNRTRHRYYIYLPQGVAAFMQEWKARGYVLDDRQALPERPDQVREYITSQASRSEILAEGRPHKVSKMLENDDTPTGVWLRARIKHQAANRRLTENLITAIREHLGIYAPDCAPGAMAQ